MKPSRHAVDGRPTPHTRSGFAVLVCAWLSATAALCAQGPPPGIPPGWVLVDDMFLPEDAVAGESAYQATPWPGGTVPYVFSSNVGSTNQSLTLAAMAEIEAVARVNFVPRTSQANYVFIQSSNVNNSYVGMVGGMQIVNIFNWSFRYIICHELMHALGYVHEHQRPDRNSFVIINYSNVQSNQSHNFNIMSAATTAGPYDFLSVMHYSAGAFSANGQPTITCRPPYAQFQGQIGHLSYLSTLDANGIASRYGAPLAPAISSISPATVAAGSSGFTLTVTGSRFLDGSFTSQGVQGTRIRWNGTDLATTFVSPTQVRANVGSAQIANAGCVEIRVNNPAPGGGLSATRTLVVQVPATGPDSWAGSGPAARLGASVAGIGDVDGDGRDDVVLGEPGFGACAGRVLCRSGATGSILWTVAGSSGDSLGASVAAAGDLDGDGRNDVVAGAPQCDGHGGSALVIGGAAGTVLRTYGGGGGGDRRFGFAVAGAGDLDGDGSREMVVGEPGYSGGDGRISVFSFNAGTGAIDTVEGAQNDAEFGASVAGGQDLNGDGRPDVVVGAPFHDSGGTDTGQVFVYTWAGSGGGGGGGGGSQGGLQLLGTRAGASTQGRFGTSVALVPSIEDTAGGCLVAGAPESGGSGGAGYVLVLGPWNGASFPVLRTLPGGAAGDCFGQAVASAGDLDQDGRTDIIVGVPQVCGASATGPGYVFVVSGRSGGTLCRIAGSASGEGSGSGAASAGDTDGDGVPDILAGSPFADTPCADSGRARILHPRVAPSQLKVMITEVTWGEPDGLEITNFELAPVDVGGWSVRWADGTTVASQPLAGVLAPGESMVVREPGPAHPEIPAGAQVRVALPALATSAQDFAVALLTRARVVVDEVRISDTAGAMTRPGLGGLFRGAARRGAVTPAAGTSGAVERIPGLDSNSGGDWTEEPATSMGLPNRSSGPRGADPLPPSFPVVINETDDDPGLIELRNAGSLGADLQGWFLRCSGAQGLPHVLLQPWPDPRPMPAGTFQVVGEGPPPTELVPGTPYVSTAELPGAPAIPWTGDEYDLGLYDDHGRVVDVMRTTGHDDVVVHNHPRTPSSWSDFAGAAGRNALGAGAIGRLSAGADSGAGSDFRPLALRTMGGPNPSSALAGPPGHGDRIDVRLAANPGSGGVSAILSAGPALAGSRWSFLFSFSHATGQGPIAGLAPEALANWLAFGQGPPLAGFLDSRGSARLDVPAGIIPAGTYLDCLFILQDAAGQLLLQTRVLELDA